MNEAPTLGEAYQLLADGASRVLGSALVTVSEPSAEGAVVASAGTAVGDGGTTIDVHVTAGENQVVLQASFAEQLAPVDADEATRLLQTLGRLTSIAERSQRERGETRLDSILERVGEGIVVANGPAVTINQAARQILGVSDERPYHPDVFNPRSLAGEALETTLGEAPRFLEDVHGGQRRFRVRITTLDEREIVIDGSVATAGGGTVIIFRDVTDEHAREILNERYLAALFHHLPVPLMVGNARERRLLSANRAFVDLTGYEADELVGLQPPFPWWDADDREVEDIEPGTVTHRTYRHKGGRSFPVEIAWHGVPGDDGEVELLLGIATELTEKRRLDMQLVQSGKLAAIGELAAGVAHEINNPLFAILGLTEFLLKEAEPESKARQRLELIQQTGLEIKDIVRALLDFARENAEERLVVPLEEVVRSTVDLVRRTNAHKGVELVDSYDGSGALVHVSPNQIKQVFLNLFANARQAMPQGGTVRIDVRQEGDRAVASVTDDGPGIEPETLPRIFEPFFTTKRATGGTGLGLSVSLGIAEAHAGSLTAASAPGQGSTFTLSLPIADEEGE